MMGNIVCYTRENSYPAHQRSLRISWFVSASGRLQTYLDGSFDPKQTWPINRLPPH